MENDFKIFDAARDRLVKGISLVEASAGTGKTYAMVMLVLRALVELQVGIEKILIVTFTKAATEELRHRIRTRLVLARNLFAKTHPEDVATDPALSSWVESIADHQHAHRLLQLALVDIDKAGIFTIHGFCQRMLAEQALESGQLFDVELLTDIKHIHAQIAEDFWRSRIYTLAPLPCALVIKEFANPETLLASVAEAKKANCHIEPQVGDVEGILFRLETSMARLTGWWKKSGSEVKVLFETGLKFGHFKKSFHEGYGHWFAELEDFVCGATTCLPAGIELLRRRHLLEELNGHKIKGDKKHDYLAAWPLPEEEVGDLLAAARDLLLSLRGELAGKLRTEVGNRLERHGNIGFDDLITRLSRALQGHRGQALKTLVGQRYAVALIDEFQDTDGMQWHIFSSLFGGGAHALYLIGDPKQAIYKFRGADIQSYFLARKSAQQMLTLEKNYRSHPFLVAEINRLFTSRPRSFYYPSDILDYRPVVAAKTGKDADLLLDGQSLAGMVYCALSENDTTAKGRWSSGKASEKFLSYVVAEIGRLLHPFLPACLHTDQQRPLAPHDIAVLVRSHRQAEAYRQALSDAGIPAVIASRESVFHAPECRDLLLLLQAILAPGEGVKLRSSLTIPWFQFSGNDLYDLVNDADGLHLLYDRFLEYHQLWREQGFLAMMNRLLVNEGVLLTLAGKRFAERAIANIFHLLELIQEQESSENLGMSQLVQWIFKMHGDSAGLENTELLLESDEEAVRIVTMHGAKGLEYPVVFCPFLWYRSDRLSGEKYQISGHDDEHRLVVDLGSDQFLKRREEAVGEQLAEDLRLLYVAVTRAKIRCYVMWADVVAHSPVADSFHSALGYLLFPHGPRTCLEQLESLQALTQYDNIQLVTLVNEELSLPISTGRTDPRTLRPPLVSTRALYSDWQMSSYSAMAMLSEYQEEKTASESRSGRQVVMPGLPMGAGFGNLIHDLLEELSFASIARGTHGKDALVQQKCLRYGVSADPAEIGRFLQQVVQTPLLPGARTGNVTLAGIDERRCLKEMAFYFHLGVLATEKVNAILANETTFLPLGHKTMRGYLTGFIDLVVEFGGKFYIIDYKTNFLGNNLSDYHFDKLSAAMQSHNYGLQYWVYTLVLHRHLQNLLEDYRYSDHFGGVMYLFLRGMHVDIPGSGVFTAFPEYQKVLALDRAIGGSDNE